MGDQMSKIIINADSETDELLVTINGKEIANVRSVNISQIPELDDPDDMELSICICTYEEDEETEVKKYTQLIARKTKEGIKAIRAGAKTLKHDNNFVVLTKTDSVEKDIQQYFNRSGV
jgi:predicted membrane GTPase involved in stress response